VIASAAGRGRQLRAGAAVASAPTLCFLHADARLPPSTLRALAGLARAADRGAWAFRLRIDSPRRRYRIVEWGANLRSRLLALPYGDQGLAIHRESYGEAGGFADVPLMEDVLLARALRRAGGITLLPEEIVASARRWERDGVVRRTISNVVLLLRFFLGATPDVLARRYREERER
jgi:rSAM/selenodomain-associated transferase 2